MRLPSVLRLTAIVAFCVVPFVRADVNLKPRTVTLAPGQRTVAEILDEIETQTGNRAIDRRLAVSPAKVDIGFDGLTYWQALDKLARQIGAQIALYHDDGVRLVDGPGRGAPVDAGVCRVEIKNLAVRRDLDGDQHNCVLQLEVAWEPTFEPLFLTVDDVSAKFAADAKGKTQAFPPPAFHGIAQQVTQRRAQIVELRLPAPDRSSPSIASLKGELKFLGATQMLMVKFANLKAGPANQIYKEPDTKDPVTVTLRKIEESKDAWSFDIDVENPKKTPAFESYQESTWTDNNRIHLERVRNGVKEIWSPNVNERVESVERLRATATYRFTNVKGKGPLADWTLVYRTPGLIVKTAVPFEFRNVVLP